MNVEICAPETKIKLIPFKELPEGCWCLFAVDSLPTEENFKSSFAIKTFGLKITIKGQSYIVPINKKTANLNAAGVYEVVDNEALVFPLDIKMFMAYQWS